MPIYENPSTGQRFEVLEGSILPPSFVRVDTLVKEPEPALVKPLLAEPEEKPVVKEPAKKKAARTKKLAKRSKKNGKN